MVSTTFPDGTPRTVNDLQYEALASAWAPDGVIGQLGDNPLVYADSSGMAVKFRAGMYAQVHGHGWYSGITDIVKTIAAPAGAPRIDLAVLGLDRSTWKVTEYVKTGTPSATPAPPTLQRDLFGTGSGKWEMPVAQITVGASVTTIDPTAVTPVQAYISGSPLLVPDKATLDLLPAGLPYGTLASVVDKPYVYTVGGWRRVDWASSWGLVAPPISTGLAGTLSGSVENRDAALGSYVFNAVAGRNYQTVLSGLKLSGTVGESYLYRIRDGKAVTPTNGSTQVGDAGQWFCPATGGPGQASVPPIITNVAYTPGVHTLSLFTVLYAGAHYVTPIGVRQLAVYDVGPSA